IERYHQPPPLEQRGRLHRLPTRGGARVEEPIAGREREQRGDELRRLALEGEAPLAPGGEPAQARGAVVDDEAVGGPDARAGRHARRRELGAARIAARAETVGTDRARPAPVVRREETPQRGAPG